MLHVRVRSAIARVGARGVRKTMLLTAGPRTSAVRGNDRLDIALVNNMPDAALRQTEEQFARLLNAGGRVRVRCYSLPTVARQGEAAAYVRAHYFPVDALWESDPAAVIVTGCEPQSAVLTCEPYWDQLTQVLQWARESVPSMMASCLAAHAALLSFDNVTRRRLPAKRSGVYSQRVAGGDALTAGLPARVVLPHSRVNDVPAEMIEAAGYHRLIFSDDFGWSAAAKEYSHHLLVLLQGHPEYDADTLLLEFRRDVRRFALGELSSFPDPPVGYFTAEAAAVVAELRDRATSAGRNGWRGPDFPMTQLRSLVGAPWQQPAERLYGNWLTEVRRRVTERVGLIGA